MLALLQGGLPRRGWGGIFERKKQPLRPFGPPPLSGEASAASIVRLAVEVLIQHQKGVRFVDPPRKLVEPVGVQVKNAAFFSSTLPSRFRSRTNGSTRVGVASDISQRKNISSSSYPNTHQKYQNQSLLKEYSAKKPYILLPSSSASPQFKQIIFFTEATNKHIMTNKISPEITPEIILTAIKLSSFRTKITAIR